MNKKVCIITTVHSVFDIRIFHKQAKTLINAGYEVSLIANHDKEEIVEGIKIIPLPKPKSRMERMFLNSFRAFNLAYREKADIYHFHDSELYWVEAGLKLLTGKVIIHDAHEHYEKDILGKIWIPPKYRKAYLSFFKLYERICLPFLDAIIYVVPDIKSRYKNYKGILEEIRNYPDLNLLEGDLSNNSKRNEHKAIFFGGITAIRGLEELIKAFKLVVNEIPDAKLDIIGKINPESYRNTLLSLIKQNELTKSVILIDQIPVTELKNFASQSSIGVVTYLPSSENNIIGLPNKIFEYMTFKLAIIASDFPLYKQIIEESGCGYTVDPTLPEKIAEKIVRLMKNPELCKKFGSSGYNAVKYKYSWANESKKLIDLYERLVNLSDLS